MTCQQIAGWIFLASALIAGVLGLWGVCPAPVALGIAAGMALCLWLLADLRRRQIQHQQETLQRQQEELHSSREEAAAREQALKEAQLEQETRLRSTISHQLRMPLSIIQGYAELLVREDIGAEQRQEYVTKILQRTKSMNDVLGQQMLACQERSFSSPACTRLDLVELVEQIVKDLSGTMANRGIGIQCLSTQEQLWVEADPNVLGRIFYNLAENAGKYMGREGLVTIRISQLDQQAQVVFQDDGMGLAEEETAHIFDLNYQGSNRKGGQGHGLYLVRRAVMAQGGTIWASSRPGQGMSITFTLPLATVEMETAALS